MSLPHLLPDWRKKDMNSFQIDWPIFVRSRYRKIIWKDKEFGFEAHVPWKELNVPENIVRAWFSADLVYHNPELEKQTKVGDRLSEFNSDQLEKLVDAINVEVKRRTNSVQEFNVKRCRKSKIDDKQRGLIRSFLRGNRWIEEEYYRIRDSFLKD